MRMMVQVVLARFINQFGYFQSYTSVKVDLRPQNSYQEGQEHPRGKCVEETIKQEDFVKG